MLHTWKFKLKERCAKRGNALNAPIEQLEKLLSLLALNAAIAKRGNALSAPIEQLKSC